jgi:hypothetical protein
VSELAATIREALAALAASDRKLTRFGAAQHRYELAPPIESAPAELPDDLRELVTTVGSGGAGPGYGFIPIARGLAHPIAPPPGITAWTHALPVAHLGCGYAALVPLDGDARGELWIDARAIGRVGPAFGTFTAAYLAWIDALAHNAWPLDVIPPGQCALAGALSGFLGMIEQQQGLAAGALAGPALRDALGQLGPGAIQIAGDEGPLFAKGEPVDPCLTCARLLDALAADGLRRDVLVAGVPPLPCR